jgi:glutathione S-transferase
MGGSRNAAKVAIALRELDEDFEIVDLNRDKDLRPADAPFRQNINPNGVTPALNDNGLLLWESSAILRHLADTRGELIGDDAASRAKTQQWLSWEASTFQPTFMSFYSATAAGQAVAAEDAKKDYSGKLTILDKALSSGGGFLTGEYSIADIALGAIVPIGFHLGVDLRKHSAITGWLEQLSNRQAWQAEPAFMQDIAAGKSANLR